VAGMGGLKTPVGIHAVERTDLGGQVAVGTAIAESVPVKNVGIGGHVEIIGAVVITLGDGESAGLVVDAQALGAFAKIVLPVIGLDDIGTDSHGLELGAGVNSFTRSRPGGDKNKT